MASSRNGWVRGARLGPVVRKAAARKTAASRLREETAALQDTLTELMSAQSPLRAENAALREETGRLRAELAVLKAKPAAGRSKSSEADALRAELAEALRRSEVRRQENRALDREIVEMRSLLAEAERQLGNVRQTFTYRIGDAIVAARTWKGIRSLPRRLYGLRRAYLEKRGQAGSGAQQKRLAVRLRYVEDALRILSEQGLESALTHVRTIPDKHVEERARTLAELAMAVRHEQPERAGGLGVAAARLNGQESRLRPLVLALFDQGAVRAPADVLAAMSNAVMARPADLARRETILAQARQLEKPLAYPQSSSAGHTGGPRLAVVSPRSWPQHAEADSWRAMAVAEAARQSGAGTLLVTAPGYHYPKSGDGKPVTGRIGDDEVIRLGPSKAPPEAFDLFVAETGAVLAASWQRRRISHVHAVAGSALASAALWAARRSGARFTLDIGALPAFGGGAGEAWAATERFRAGFSLFADTAKTADTVVVRSQALARELAARGFDRSMVVIEDAVPEEFVRSPPASVQDIRRELGLGDQRLIGVFESLDGDEGLADLVRALPAIRVAHPDVVVMFCGSGKGAQTLQRLAAQLDVAEHVITPAGFVRHRTADYLSAFSVAAFPKRRVGAPGLSAPFELQAALAVGAPVVAADNAWSRDWITDQQTGLLTPPGDVAALSRAIMRCLDEGAFADRLGEAGLARVQSRGRRAIIDPQITATLDDPAGRAAA